MVKTTVITTKRTVWDRIYKEHTVPKVDKEDEPVSYTAADIHKLAPKAQDNIREAYETVGLPIHIQPDVKYAGHFGIDGEEKGITLRRNGDVLYHELGHFVAWVAGSVDTKPEFRAVYEAEKEKLAYYNKEYVNSSSGEYFAECYRMYVLENDTLKKQVPKTYAQIKKAIQKVTPEQTKRTMLIFHKYLIKFTFHMKKSLTASLA